MIYIISDITDRTWKLQRNEIINKFQVIYYNHLESPLCLTFVVDGEFIDNSNFAYKRGKKAYWRQQSNS